MKVDYIEVLQLFHNKIEENDKAAALHLENGDGRRAAEALSYRKGLMEAGDMLVGFVLQLYDREEGL